MARILPEPFRIKVVEPIRLPSLAQRERLLSEVGYNVFRVRSEDVFIDLPTDNASSAMSDRQWSAMMQADESYASPRSYFTLVETLRRCFGFEHVAWTHQGRAAEHVLFSVIVRPGHTVLGNAHFQTTRWNIEASGGVARDLLVAEGYDPQGDAPFKGNIDLDRLAREIEALGADRVPLVILSLTNNNNGGQPVSLENVRACKEIVAAAGIPLFFDAARYAENAYLIQQREVGLRGRAVRDIVAELFSYADGFFMSAKKDGLVNMGALLAVRDGALFEQVARQMNVREGFLTHAGLSGRDMEALAVGIEEALEEPYLAYRIGQVAYLAELLRGGGVPLFQPAGGHAVHIDASRFLGHLEPEGLPSEALTAELYREGAIRASPLSFGVTGETGGAASPIGLVRLAIPRRVYTQSHLDYVADVIRTVYARRHEVRGLRRVSPPSGLPMWTTRYEQV